MYVSGPSQKTPEWYQERAVRLTGSNWYNILKGKEKPSGLIGRRHGSKFSEMCKAYGDRYEKAALRSVQTFLNPSGLRIEGAKFYIPQARGCGGESRRHGIKIFPDTSRENEH